MTIQEKNWIFLMKRKNEVASKVIELIESMQKNSKYVKYLRYDNAREHNALIPYMFETTLL